MKAGISTVCTAKFLETEDGINLISGIGADCAEVFLRTFYEYRPEFAKKYSVRAENTQICSVRVNSSDFEPHLFETSRRVRGDGFYWLDQIMRSAQTFGAKNYTFKGFSREYPDFDNFGFYGERLREACDFCSRYGVRLCLENSANAVFNRPLVFREIRRYYPEITGSFNLSEAVKSGYPYTMYLAEMQGSILNAHICDRDEEGNFRLPGEGGYDFDEIIKRLRDVGFDGNIYIDCGGCADENALKRAYEFLKEIIYKVS